MDSRCSAEYITPTFLPCILIGLNNAPKICDKNIGININDVDFLVMPYNSIGGIPVLEMDKLNKRIYTVRENQTILDVTSSKLGIKCNILNSYQELIDMI